MNWLAVSSQRSAVVPPAFRWVAVPRLVGVGLHVTCCTLRVVTAATSFTNVAPAISVNFTGTVLPAFTALVVPVGEVKPAVVHALTVYPASIGVVLPARSLTVAVT